MRKLTRLLSGLLWDRKAAALTEFALVLPMIMGVGLLGLETAYYTVMHMRVQQAAAHIADNASRIGDTSTIDQRKIYEDDIRDLMIGGDIQLKALDLFEHGRVIISSLEEDQATKKQWLHWQRCMGRLGWYSTYGEAGGPSSTIKGMGPKGRKVSALSGQPVMFVEVAYDYQPLISASFIGTHTMHAYSAFTVRADRDLSKIYQRDDYAPTDVADCDTHEDLEGNPGDGTMINEPGQVDGPGTAGNGNGNEQRKEQR